jgi:hypothetical protein
MKLGRLGLRLGWVAGSLEAVSAVKGGGAEVRGIYLAIPLY